jgi:hypothetical protein
MVRIGRIVLQWQFIPWNARLSCLLRSNALGTAVTNGHGEFPAGIVAGLTAGKTAFYNTGQKELA